jgi:hypothetical protein
VPALPSPLLSIIVPARNSADVLLDTLDLLSRIPLTPDSIEFVVSDNSDVPLEINQEFRQDARFRIVRPNSVVSMRENFAFGFLQSRGLWVTYIGSDDGVFPSKIVSLFSILAATTTDAVVTEPAYFMYPPIGDAGGGAFECFIGSWETFPQTTRRLMRRAKWSLAKAENLPIPYNRTVVRRSVVEEVRRRSGDTFMSSSSPDLYLGWAIASVRESVLRLEGSPVFISGISEFGNGYGVRRNNDRIREHFAQNASSLAADLRIGVRHSVQLETLDPVLATRSLRGSNWRPNRIRLLWNVYLRDPSVPEAEITQSLADRGFSTSLSRSVLLVRRALGSSITYAWITGVRWRKFKRFVASPVTYVSGFGGSLRTPGDLVHVLERMDSIGLGRWALGKKVYLQHGSSVVRIKTVSNPMPLRLGHPFGYRRHKL